MTTFNEIFPQTFLIKNIAVKDDRGSFCKQYTQDLLKEIGINFSVYEQFYTRSDKDVIRGMHFTLPPYAQSKIVSCLYGAVIDVIVDLRLGPNYGNFLEIPLNAQDSSFLILPSGIGHGFKSLVDNSLVTYSTDKKYHVELDAGIHYQSFGYDWSLDSPIISKRDTLLTNLADFVTPFHE